LPTDGVATELDFTAAEATAHLRAPLRYDFRSIPANGLQKAHQERLLDSEANDDATCRSIDTARRIAYEEGHREGEHAARMTADLATAVCVAKERTRIAAALCDFRNERNQYFFAMEREVVRLALAIAARVLHREVQLDPLLLAGVARVALDKLADRSGATLRVPVSHLAEWQKVFASIDPSDQPTVTSDPSLTAAECIVETRMGTVELGVAAQLEEIERGFFDILNHRPKS
jgi:flagellar assembly protein FliH